jgi:hypothetical protein
MQPKPNKSNKQAENFERPFKCTAALPLSEIFKDKKLEYLNACHLFLVHFNCIPNYIGEIGIDCLKANDWFAANYVSEIRDIHYSKGLFSKGGPGAYDDIYYILDDDLLVQFNVAFSFVHFLFRKTNVSKIEMIIASLQPYKERTRKRKPKISLLINSSQGIYAKALQISKPRFNISNNYNDDFLPIHQTIVRQLSKRNSKGLVILHGKPGTGKTSYIRYLITILKKEVIFLPPNMASSITDPNLISILVDKPNSIFVIEDAENIVMARESNSHSPVSALLNISDGLLSDCLNIQVICSFNTDISKVDSALLRKGRIIAKYEFKELDISKAQILSDKLLFKRKVYNPMTLTEIYNQNEMNFSHVNERKAIGFLANNN